MQGTGTYCSEKDRAETKGEAMATHRATDSQYEPSLLINVIHAHSAVKLGKSHSQDDAWQQEDGAPTQTEPEGILDQEKRKGVSFSGKALP